MQIRVFTIPIHGNELVLEEVNLFLRQHKVLTLERQFSSSEGGYWTIFATFQENSIATSSKPPLSRTGKVDYREVLSPEAFAKFAKLREIRKELAAKNAIPSYAVFTDEELSKIAQLETLTVSAICSINGISKRAEKYAADFIHAFDDIRKDDIPPFLS
ncbi:MAG: HRDC domain-containing protein [Alloprevotella sp.]